MTRRRPWDSPTTAPLRGALAFSSLLFAATCSAGCASKVTTKPNEPLITGEPKWPEDVTKDVTRVDRQCNAREAKLNREYKEAKEEEEKFKTMLGTISGGVGTVGGAIGGVGAFAIKDQDTVKTMTGVTGFITAGLGAVGGAITAVYKPGADRMKSSSESLAAIADKKDALQTTLAKKDPASWSDDDRAAYSKALKDLEAVCKE